MNFFDSMKETMEWVAKQPNTLFIGQAVGTFGTFMSGTLKDIPIEQRLEFPVCESFQMQFSFGMALTGKTVISVFPRQNFLLLATHDMVNLLDKAPELKYNLPALHIILRSASGPYQPIDPGHQHKGNYSEIHKKLFKYIQVHDINTPDEALPTYQKAMEQDGIHLILEDGNAYHKYA